MPLLLFKTKDFVAELVDGPVDSFVVSDVLLVERVDFRMAVDEGLVDIVEVFSLEVFSVFELVGQKTKAKVVLLDFVCEKRIDGERLVFLGFCLIDCVENGVLRYFVESSPGEGLDWFDLASYCPVLVLVLWVHHEVSPRGLPSRYTTMRGLSVLSWAT